jgi:transposase
MGSSPAYPSDLTDAQWALIEPLVPVRSTRGKGTRGGRPPKFPRRRIVDAILYLDRTGCSWRQLPHDFPPWDTVYFYFQRWAADGTVDRIHDGLRDAVRDAAGRDPLASAGAVDSQTVPGGVHRRPRLPRLGRGQLVGQSGFVPLPRRWVVERTHAWITGHRRMSRDYERLPAHSEATIKWAMIGLMARRLAPGPGRRPWQPARTA